MDVYDFSKLCDMVFYVVEIVNYFGDVLFGQVLEVVVFDDFYYFGFYIGLIDVVVGFFVIQNGFCCRYDDFSGFFGVCDNGFQFCIGGWDVLFFDIVWV